MSRAFAFTIALVVLTQGGARKRELREWKVQDVYEWALEQDFGLATVTVPLRLRDERVDGEMLPELTKEDIEQYLHLEPIIAQHLHDAIGRLLGLADVTNEFQGEKYKIIVARGKTCPVRCCCTGANPLPGERNHCILVQRPNTWRGPRGCGAEGAGWHSYQQWGKGCFVPAKLAPLLRTCAVQQDEGFRVSPAELFRVLWFVLVIGSVCTHLAMVCSDIQHANTVKLSSSRTASPGQCQEEDEQSPPCNNEDRLADTQNYSGPEQNSPVAGGAELRRSWAHLPSVKANVIATMEQSEFSRQPKTHRLDESDEVAISASSTDSRRSSRLFFNSWSQWRALATQHCE
jgi:hypothetical protein